MAKNQKLTRDDAGNQENPPWKHWEVGLSGKSLRALPPRIKQLLVNVSERSQLISLRIIIVFESAGSATRRDRLVDAARKINEGRERIEQEALRFAKRREDNR